MYIFVPRTYWDSSHYGYNWLIQYWISPVHGFVSWWFYAKGKRFLCLRALVSLYRVWGIVHYFLLVLGTSLAKSSSFLVRLFLCLRSKISTDIFGF